MGGRLGGREKCSGPGFEPGALIKDVCCCSIRIDNKSEYDVKT